jgi:hypothetical protein
MKKLITISLLLIISLFTLNNLTQAEQLHTIPTEDIEQVNIGSATIQLNGHTQEATYNSENSLLLVNDTNISTITIKQTNTFLGSSYEVVGLN